MTDAPLVPNTTTTAVQALERSQMSDWRRVAERDKGAGPYESATVVLWTQNPKTGKLLYALGVRTAPNAVTKKLEAQAIADARYEEDDSPLATARNGVIAKTRMVIFGDEDFSPKYVNTSVGPTGFTQLAFTARVDWTAFLQCWKFLRQNPLPHFCDFVVTHSLVDMKTNEAHAEITCALTRRTFAVCAHDRKFVFPALARANMLRDFEQ